MDKLSAFKTIFYFINNTDIIESSFNIIGIIMLFISFEFFIYLKVRDNKKNTYYLFNICYMIEISQLILSMRQTDTDGLILNFLGKYRNKISIKICQNR